MFDIKERGERRGRQRFPPPDGVREIDNQTDAFRHAYANALMTQKFGEEWTRKFATAHEGRENNYASSEAMDLYNNEIGRQIAVDNPNASPRNSPTWSSRRSTTATPSSSVPMARACSGATASHRSKRAIQAAARRSMAPRSPRRTVRDTTIDDDRDGHEDLDPVMDLRGADEHRGRGVRRRRR